MTFQPGTRTKMIRDKKDTPRDEFESVRPVNSQIGRMAYLCLKLHEEAGEVAAAPTDVYEYADVLEVLRAIGKLHGVTFEQMEAARIEKREKFGGFDKGLIFARSVQ